MLLHDDDDDDDLGIDEDDAGVYVKSVPDTNDQQHDDDKDDSAPTHDTTQLLTSERESNHGIGMKISGKKFKIIWSYFLVLQTYFKYSV